MSDGSRKYIETRCFGEQCRLDLTSVLEDLPAEDRVELRANDGRSVRVPRIMIKMCGGNLAGLMRLADTRLGDTSIRVPFDWSVVSLLKDFFTGETIRVEREWMELFNASKMYQMEELSHFLLSESAMHALLVYARRKDERMFKLMTFATKHSINSLVAALAANKTLQKRLSTPEGIVEYTKALLRGCQCSECTHVSTLKGTDSSLTETRKMGDEMKSDK